jgi:class 3 adenylate cyclase/pimeloyl-ACP methyl ester carboxylesterase
VELPETRYARSGDVSIAYQVLGDGPFDLVRIPPFVSHVELAWQIPSLAAFNRELASFCRLITFDKRGTGMSDRVSGVPALAVRMDDVRAVMDAAGSRSAAVLGASEGGAMSVLFAATHPDRVWGLVLDAAAPRSVWAPDYPWAPTEEEWARHADVRMREWETAEGVRAITARVAPSASHEDLEGFGHMVRQSASPGAAAALVRMNTLIDVRHVLPSVHVPTLVVNRVDDSEVTVRGSRYLAEHIPGARHLEVPGSDHVEFVGDTEPFIAAVREFLADAWAARGAGETEPDRVLATVLFTDIVGSTAKAAELGDARWRELVLAHHGLVRRQLARYRGTEIDTAGDGFFASFDGPARAIRCASAIADGVRELGIEIRAGLHTGECERIDNKVGGIAVSIGARVASEARPGEVLVSSTVKDLVAGSGIEFRERGVAELKGVPGEWRLFAVAEAGSS